MQDKEVLSAAPLTRELFLKGYSDPLGGHNFEAVQVRTSALNSSGRYPDLCPRYSGASPLHYAIVIAPSGFAAEESLYQRLPARLLRDAAGLRELFAGDDANAAVQRRYHAARAARSLREAAASYDEALRCANFLRLNRHEVAGLKLRASWLLRECLEAEGDAAPAGDRRRMAQLRSDALQLYQQAYEQEDLKETKLGYHGVCYLIGELLREAGRYEESYRWLTRAVHDRALTGELLRLARERLELCQQQRRDGHPPELDYPQVDSTKLPADKPSGPAPGVAPVLSISAPPPRHAELVLNSIARDDLSHEPEMQSLLQQEISRLQQLEAIARKRGMTVDELLRILASQRGS